MSETTKSKEELQAEKKALKEKLKLERKELRKAKKQERIRSMKESEDTNPLKFKEWFSLKGIREEIKNVHWLTKKELARDASVVLVFTIILGVYFYFSDAIIALILKALGMN